MTKIFTTYGDKILSLVPQQLFKKNDFILGREVINFENNFAKFCKSKYAISCANGTDAITIALKSLNLPDQSEVIIPAMTYCSTAFAVINANLKPVLVDTEYLKPTMNLNDLKRKITKKTKVILPVHLYGSIANLKGIKKLIKNNAIGAASIHKNQTANPPKIPPKLFPLPPTMTITQIRNVYRIGL